VPKGRVAAPPCQPSSSILMHIHYHILPVLAKGDQVSDIYNSPSNSMALPSISNLPPTIFVKET